MLKNHNELWNDKQIKFLPMVASRTPIERFDPKTFLESVGEGKVIALYPPGQVIFRQGERADTVFYLQRGRAKEIVKSEQGKEAVIGVLEPGIFFGVSALDGGIRTTTVSAVTHCTVTTITRATMTSTLREPLFARLFMHYLVNYNHQIEAEKVDLLFNNREKRLAQKLLVLAHVDESREASIIGPEINQEMLADMIGTTRAYVNKFLTRFRKEGWIKYDARGITVLPELLRVVLQDVVTKGEKK